MSIVKIRIRLAILIITTGVIYACASVSREVMAPATTSSTVTPDKPAAVEIPEAARQKQKRQRSEKESVLQRPLEKKSIGKQESDLDKTEERTAPAAAPLLNDSVSPKREMLEEGGIGGTGNTDCADKIIKPGCSKTD